MPEPPTNFSEPEISAKSRAEIFKHYISQRGTRYLDCMLQNFEADTEEKRGVVKQLEEMIVERKCVETCNGNNLVFVGPVGTGKDHLMTAAIRGLTMCDFFKSGQTVIWENGSRLFAKFRDGISDGAGEIAGRSEYTSCRLLVLSDLCRAGQTLKEFQQQIIYDIIDRRYSFRRPTWVSINASGRGEMVSMFGADIVDRLLHDATVISCVWDSYRKLIDRKSSPPPRRHVPEQCTVKEF